MRNHPTPLGAVGRGLFAGVVGTAAMTGWQELAAKLQQAGEGSGGSEEEAAGSSEEKAEDPWEEASTPAKVFRRISEGVFEKPVPAERIELVSEAMHWGYGTTWGGVFGLLAGTRGRASLGGGLAFGIGVWGASYAQLVPMGLYEPPWKYPPKELALDLSYHLVYGAAVATGYRVLS